MVFTESVQVLERNHSALPGMTMKKKDLDWNGGETAQSRLEYLLEGYCCYGVTKAAILSTFTREYITLNCDFPCMHHTVIVCRLH